MKNNTGLSKAIEILYLIFFILAILLSGCSGSRYISKSQLPVSGGNYVINGEKAHFPEISNAVVKNGNISGRFDFSGRKVQSDERFQVYVKADSLIKVNGDSLSVPVESIKRIVIDYDHYGTLKKKYNYLNYSFKKGDPYSPMVVGFASVIVPGLGQLMVGEGGRGSIFFAGYVGCIYTSLAKFVQYSNSHEGEDAKAFTTSIAAFMCAIGIDIMSAIDAGRIAKVKNMAIRNRRGTSFDINFQSVSINDKYSLRSSVSYGLSFKVNF
jgi:hypothetical protein